MALEGLGRDPVELGQPATATLGRLVAVAHPGEDHHGSLDVVGRPSGRLYLAAQFLQRRPVLVGREEERDPSVSHRGGPVAGGLARASYPCLLYTSRCV